MNELDATGYIEIDNEPDRIAVASILFKNGYTASKVRQKRNGKAYKYFVKYEKKCPDEPEVSSNGG